MCTIYLLYVLFDTFQKDVKFNGEKFKDYIKWCIEAVQAPDAFKRFKDGHILYMNVCCIQDWHDNLKVCKQNFGACSAHPLNEVDGWL